MCPPTVGIRTLSLLVLALSTAAVRMLPLHQGEPQKNLLGEQQPIQAAAEVRIKRQQYTCDCHPGTDLPWCDYCPNSPNGQNRQSQGNQPQYTCDCDQGTSLPWCDYCPNSQNQQGQNNQQYSCDCHPGTDLPWCSYCPNSA